MNAQIAKGKQVEVKTTNGGLIVATLEYKYTPSYSVSLIVEHGHVIAIPGWRISSVREVVQ